MRFMSFSMLFKPMAVALLLFSCSFGASVGSGEGVQKHKAYKANDISRSQGSAQPNQPNIGLPSTEIRTTSEIRNSEEDAKECSSPECTKEDLEAQRRMADSAKHTVWVGIFNVVFALVSVILLACAYKQTRIASKAATDTLTIAQNRDRPYVFVKVTEFNNPLIQGIDHRLTDIAEPMICIQLDNFGQSPAVIKSIHISVWAYDHIPVTPPVLTNAHKSSYDREVVPVFSAGLPLHCGQAGNITPEDRKAVIAKTKKVFAYGAVAYEDATGKGYVTAFGQESVSIPHIELPSGLQAGGNAYNYRT